MSRSTPIHPEDSQELQRWQRQSESKIAPGTPRHRIHELPGLAAENEAAAPPTIIEELPVTTPDIESPLGERDLTQEKKKTADPEQGLIEDSILERFEDDGGPTDEQVSGSEPDLRSVDAANR